MSSLDYSINRIVFDTNWHGLGQSFQRTYDFSSKQVSVSQHLSSNVFIIFTEKHPLDYYQLQSPLSVTFLWPSSCSFPYPNKDIRSPFNVFAACHGFADRIVGLLTCPLGVGYPMAWRGTETNGPEFPRVDVSRLLYHLHRLVAEHSRLGVRPLNCYHIFLSLLKLIESFQRSLGFFSCVECGITNYTWWKNVA